MSAGNLKLGVNSSYNVIHVPMLQISQWWGEGRLRPTLWQRAPRWNSKRDTDQWITCVLQNTPVVPIFVHQRESEDGAGTEYLIIDGQNRSKAVHTFLSEGTSKVRAGDVLRSAAAPDDMLAFSDFSLEQRERIANHLVPICVFGPMTTEGELRRVFRNLNRGKTLSSYEIIRSWNHVPIVRDVLNPLDERLCSRFLAINPRWRPQNHRMLHTYIRIAAFMYSDWLHLQNADRIEQWVACRTFPVSDADIAPFVDVVDLTLRMLEMWFVEGVVPSISAVPDLAWAVHAFRDIVPLERLLSVLIGPLRIAIHNEIDQVPLWYNHPAGLTIDVVRERRSFISGIVCEELDCGGPPSLGRTANEQPNDGVVSSEPTEEDLEAAHALLSLQPRPRTPPIPEVLVGWQPNFEP